MGLKQTESFIHVQLRSTSPSSMLFLILLYPNSNMENKTRKKKTKIISIHQAGLWLFPDLSSFWRSVLAAADMVSVGLACSWCLLITSAGLGCVSSRSSPPRWRCSVSWRNIHSTMNSGKKFFRTECLTMLQKTKHWYSQTASPLRRNLFLCATQVSSCL